MVKSLNRTSKPRSLLSPLTWIFGALGLLSTGIGLAALTNEIRFGQRAAPVSGTVVALARPTPTSVSAAGSDMSYPVVRFRAASGEQIEFSSGATGAAGVGDSVPVLYDPKHPRTACIDGFSYRWLWPLIGCAFSAAFGFAAWICAVLGAKEREVRTTGAG